MREPKGLVGDCCVFDSQTETMVGIKVDGMWFDSPNLSINYLKKQLGITAREAMEYRRSLPRVFLK